VLIGAVLVALALVASGACGGGSDGDSGSDVSSDETTTSAPVEDAGDDPSDEGDDSSTTLPPGATPGLDDYGGDGEKDPTCGTQDFGGGLVLRKPCEVATPNEPPEGVTLVDGSLFAYNGSIDIDLTGISGSLLLARDEAGIETIIVTFNSDNLFEVNSSEVRSPETMDNTIKLINQRWPDSTLQVRGHTDGTGGVNANQRLSEARAVSTKTYMESHGLKAKSITTVGLGATQPFAKEDSDDARRFNRRVEIVVRVY
jgi:outer membrane protein OmpA-like peptidoglycan-associated protein